MGNLLERPNMRTDTEVAEGLGLLCASSSAQGWRRDMEVRVLVWNWLGNSRGMGRVSVGRV
jgi:hypothetical protein